MVLRYFATWSNFIHFLLYAPFLWEGNTIPLLPNFLWAGVISTSITSQRLFLKHIQASLLTSLCTTLHSGTAHFLLPCGHLFPPGRPSSTLTSCMGHSIPALGHRFISTDNSHGLASGTALPASRSEPCPPTLVREGVLCTCLQLSPSLKACNTNSLSVRWDLSSLVYF